MKEMIFSLDDLEYTKRLLMHFKCLNDSTLNECREVYAKAIKRHDPTRTEFTTYWFACVRNIARAYYKRDKLPIVFCDPHLLREASIVERTKQEDDAEEVRELLTQLPNEYRSVAECLWIDGMTKEETSQYLRLSYGRVRYVEHAAIQYLRRKHASNRNGTS